MTALAVVGCASYASQIQSQAHFTVFAPGHFGPANTACITFRGVRALPCQRGGIIGTSNFRASDFSRNSSERQWFWVMFNQYIAIHSFIHIFVVYELGYGSESGEKMLSR